MLIQTAFQPPKQTPGVGVGWGAVSLGTDHEDLGGGGICFVFNLG